IAHPGRAHPIPKNVLSGDRYEYDADDVVGQFFVSFAAPPTASKASIVIRLIEGDKAIDEARTDAEARAQFSFRIETKKLRAGKYTVRAELDPAPAAKTPPLEFHFTRTDKKAKQVAMPEGGIPISIEPAVET